MQNKKLTMGQTILTIVLMNFSSSVVVGVNTTVEQNAWIAILGATLMALPFFLLYARIIQLFPGKDLFQIAEILFGSVGGKLINILLVWYALHVSTLVLRNFSEFTQTSALSETPQLPIIIILVLTAIYLAKSGVVAIGKWSIVAASVVLLIVSLTVLGAIPHMKISSILPVTIYPINKMVHATTQSFAFPYAETVIFLCLGDSMERGTKVYKIFLWGLAITASILLLVFFRNLTLLGRAMMSTSYFPSYEAARIIEVGNFLERIEGSITFNFIMAGIVKLTICLLAVSKGLASLFQLRKVNTLAVPVGMLSIALSSTMYKNLMEMFTFIPYYFYYALPFQVVIPIALWIAGEIHVRKTGEEPATEDG